MKKVGILGGTFDPIHIGHLVLAQAAFEQLELDFVRIIPAGIPPHKIGRKCASKEQRLEMTNLAISRDPHFVLDTIEIDKETPSYTCETLALLHDLHPDEDYYFIIGQDSLNTFHTWYKPDAIASLAHIVAADRPGYDKSQMESVLEENRKMFNGDFICIECPDIQISSTDVRNRMASGSSIRYLVPEKVFDYIQEEGLYK